MAWARAGLAVAVATAVAVALLSGGSTADPRTPAALPGMPPPFLGTAVVGSGETTAAIDAYGDVVDLRDSPAGPPLIDNSAARQAAGTVPASTGIVPVARIGGRELTFWRADQVRQRYRAGTNVVVTEARFGKSWAQVAYAADAGRLACLSEASSGSRVSLRSDEPGLRSRLRCDGSWARGAVESAEHRDRRWLARARPLGGSAPVWAVAMYRRSLLTLRALTDRRSGAVAAGARDDWALVWPRDAGVTALAFAAAGYGAQAGRVAGFLRGLDLEAAARFHGDGAPVAGRAAQGDAAGWVAVAARAAGLPAAAGARRWRARGDYQERGEGDYLGNAIAAGAALGPFRTPRGLVRVAGEPESGLDPAAAWAVRPFPRPALFPAVRHTLLRLSASATPFGIVPGEDWPGGIDPWTAPTVWTAWSLAALGERRAALRLLGDLRRAATPAGALPERVDARTGVPHSTTPLAWSHAFAVLALRELWPR